MGWAGRTRALSMGRYAFLFPACPARVLAYAEAPQGPFCRS